MVQGLADHFIPAGGWQKLVILNPGHTCNYTSSPYQGSETVIELLNAGYAVLATYMPLYTPLQCVGSPIATNLGAFIVDATNQSAWHLTSQGWQSLGGYTDR